MKQINQRKKSLKRTKGNFTNITIDNIVQMQTSNNYQKIIELQSVILKEFSNDYRILTLLGKAHKENNNFDKAIHFFNLSLRINPNYIIALNNLGNIYNSINKYEEAIILFLKAINQSPNNNVLLLNLGNSYYGNGNYKSAIEYYKQTLNIEPNNSDAHYNLANAYFKINENLIAIEHIIKAINLKSDSKNFWKAFGYICSHTVFEKYDHDIANKINLFLDQNTNYNSNISKSLFGKLKKYSPITEFLSRKKESYNPNNVNDICTNLNKTYFPKLITNIITTDIDFFILCQNLREFILFNIEQLKGNNEVLNIMKLISKQCYMNEYTFYATDIEKSSFNKLKEIFKSKIENSEILSELELYVLSSYEYQEFLEVYLDKIEKLDSSKFIFKKLKNSLKEKEYKLNFVSTYIFKNKISKAVSSMYEENPYPRWEVANVDQSNFTMQQFAKNKNIIAYNNYPENKPIKILIAGCGTGAQAVSLSGLFKNSLIEAIDISSSSLAYAKRKAEDFEIKNINFSKFDILDLENLNDKYDYIECSGVLHHMEEPEKGFRILIDSLNINGIMKIGLYSYTARYHINKAREFLKSKNIKFSLEQLRDFRNKVIEKNPSHREFEKLLSNADFYSTSECRDLIFHIQEKQYDLLEIKTLLNKFSLKFAGFDFSNQYTQQHFKERFPEKNSEYYLDNWKIYEEENVNTFIGMYNFFLIK